MIGTGNDYECYGSTNGCNVYTAGQQFDSIAHDVQSHLDGEGYSWQETVWLGDDLEAEWDDWSISSSFINGIANKESTYSSHAFLVDFGDADYGQSNIQGGPVWTQQNVYDASWGIGWDVPVPETYTGWLTQQWVNVYNSGSVNKYAGTIQFYGNMAECSEGDTLPTNTCWQSGNGQCEWSPELGYNNLSADVGQSAIPYTTNIRYQGSSPSGNNGCP